MKPILLFGLRAGTHCFKVLRAVCRVSRLVSHAISGTAQALCGLFLFGGLMSNSMAETQALESKPNDPYFEVFHPLKAPPAVRHFLKPHDRLAIIGDSITEQRMYSRFIETYLAVCVPELDVSVRQFGWSGERAPQFLARMTNDCLRFKPTIATTCYGMNDHLYGFYTDAIGETYRTSSVAIVESFKAHGVRVIQGSPGCVGKKPSWRNTTNATAMDLNTNLCVLRNIGIGVAQAEKVGFADVFWPMLTQGHFAQLKYGTNYTISGVDGVHPEWAGHVVMAYAFLHSFGLDGEIGTFTVDMKSKKATVSSGHEKLAYKDGVLTIKSHRFPFCIGEGNVSKSDNINSGTALVPFNQELNRLMLVVKRPQARSYRVTWGGTSKLFTAAQLTAGINLAEEFLVNPFTEAFNKVDEAVAAKQKFETTEIKKTFRSDAAKKDMEYTVAVAEAERAPLANAIKDSFHPVTHTIQIAPE